MPHSWSLKHDEKRRKTLKEVTSRIIMPPGCIAGVIQPGAGSAGRMNLPGN